MTGFTITFKVKNSMDEGLKKIRERRMKSGQVHRKAVQISYKV